jgi:hypothetical protein
MVLKILSVPLKFRQFNIKLIVLILKGEYLSKGYDLPKHTLSQCSSKGGWSEYQRYLPGTRHIRNYLLQLEKQVWRWKPRMSSE